MVTVLFLCTGNSARSILAEALLNRMGEGRFAARSAGSQPKSAVHPAALALLRAKGFPTEELRSKSWDEFAGGAPLDIVITVCGNAAGEVCPVWPGHPVIAHWGIDDPAAVEGPRQVAAFVRAYDGLAARVAQLVALPSDAFDAPDLGRRLRAIAEKVDD